MKIKLSQPKEWGSFINPVTLQKGELKGEIPEKSLVIIKKKEFREEIDKVVILTNYCVIQDNKLLNLPKKEFTIKLAKRCAEFIVKNKILPPNTSILKITSSDKPIQLSYTHSKQEIFELILTTSMFPEQDMNQIIVEIMNTTKKDVSEEREKKWKIEYSPHGRIPCKKCKKQIRTNDIRIGESYYKDEELNFYWYHIYCFNLSTIKDTNIEGLDDLKEEDKKKIAKKLA